MNEDKNKALEKRVRNIVKNLGLSTKEDSIAKKTSINQEEFDRLLAEHEKKLKELSQLVKDQEVFNPARTPIYLSWKAYKRILGYSLRYSNEAIEQSEWREVYGFLIGYIEDEKRLIVADAIPMTVGDATGVEYEYIHYVDAAEIDSNVFQRSIDDDKNEFTVGWWHSHPGYGHFFSPTDTMTQLSFQCVNPFAIAIEFDNTEKTKENLGIKALRLKNPSEGMESEYDYVEIRFFTDDDQEIFKNIEETVEKMKVQMPAVINSLEKIEKNLIERELPIIDKKFSLVLSSEEEIEEEDVLFKKKSYIWDQESIGKPKEMPKFRAKIEEEIKKCQVQLEELKKNENHNEYEGKKEDFKERIKTLLDKPNKMLHKVMDDFGTLYADIDPFRDFLDSKERKTLEHFEEWIYDYFRVLDNMKFSIANL